MGEFFLDDLLITKNRGTNLITLHFASYFLNLAISTKKKRLLVSWFEFTPFNPSTTAVA